MSSRCAVDSVIMTSSIALLVARTRRRRMGTVEVLTLIFWRRAMVARCSGEELAVRSWMLPMIASAAPRSSWLTPMAWIALVLAWSYFRQTLALAWRTSVQV